MDPQISFMISVHMYAELTTSSDIVAEAMANNIQTVGFQVATAILVAGVLLLALLVLMLSIIILRSKRKAKNNNDIVLKGTVSTTKHE